MIHWLRLIWFFFIVRPLVLVGLGLNVRHRERLLASRPAILAANHNSHLDTLVLMTVFPLRQLKWLRPVAARDYFYGNRALAWFAEKVIGIVPIDRHARGAQRDPLAECSAALLRGEILFLFPEGTRGEPEQMKELHTGIAHLAERHPAIPVIPVFMHGLGKALPKGEGLLVPFFCDVFVGEALYWGGERAAFMRQLEERMRSLAAEGHFPDWE